ncbi:MAG TPA: gliding motility lipoprotein GldH [Chitinophagaceae bacterium]|nr:gliding motility lipoprotein GldH [Chitinophagaceae bacterium]MCC6635751.1 gliding motility lipoprotein GldH [Chitinophagaceae bacterium]HMZ45334.1 gliding motility lipoprotein GldH [Chitinophagaceae bacterium]HNE92891.1 gliding motility lipoprotein GldH [Chitinophagaceae bacterium]HNF29628.1 gliding motility lipoprotein GldH [Chitinophagaceae bacterium]
MKFTAYLFFVMAFFSSCTTLDVYERTTFFNNHQWKSQQPVQAVFEISDTTTLYNLYFVLRHEDAYKYNNIWVDISMQSPDTTISVKRNFVLGDNEKWLGSSMSDIIEHRIKFSTAPAKLKKGKYIFTLHQIMREDPLHSILNAGIRVERTK